MQLTLDIIQAFLLDLPWVSQCVLAIISVLLVAFSLAHTINFNNVGICTTLLETLSIIKKCPPDLELYFLLPHLSNYIERIAVDYGSLIFMRDSALWSGYLLSLAGMRNNIDVPQTRLNFPDSNTPLNIISTDHDPLLSCDNNIVCLLRDSSITTQPSISGLVNIGNSCFLNSVLQAFSSLPQLQTHLEAITRSSRGKSLPVTRALLKTLRLLTRPIYKASSLKPTEITSALQSKNLLNCEQQDAEEFFQLISGRIDKERQAVQEMEVLGGGLKDMLSTSFWKKTVTGKRIYSTTKRSFTSNENTQSISMETPFTGLLASRLSCMQCGYTEAVRHFSFNNIQLSLPEKCTTTLESCLDQFTAMEYLSDASCRKCSLINTLHEMSMESESIYQQLASDTTSDNEMKTRAETLDTMRAQIQQRLNANIVDDITQLPLSFPVPHHTVSRASSKQVMIAKSPKILCLHINRSSFHPSGTILKNPCHVKFPEYLSLSLYSTSNTLQTQPQLPISAYEEGDYSSPRYRLMSIIVHYGSHHSGHFITYKRHITATQCNCGQCSKHSSQSHLQAQQGWYKVSDESVEPCSIQTVLQANPYMLMYEQEHLLVESSVKATPAGEVEPSIVNDDIWPNFYSNPTNEPPSSLEALRIVNTLLSDDQHMHDQVIVGTSKEQRPLKTPSISSLHWNITGAKVMAH
ncbi:hypothetical protein BDF14DRAFT_1816942 [Spinellus fusiger]|nr:hypothetical protein BDF14DRAFT_1816942 [Spinellus fusiger]